MKKVLACFGVLLVGAAVASAGQVYAVNLRDTPNTLLSFPVSMPAENNAYDWYELCDLFGIVPHIGGVHLAQLRMVHRMATIMEDI